MKAIAFQSILPTLVALTAALAALWLIFWGITRAIDRVARHYQRDEHRRGVSTLARQITLLLRRATGFVTLVVAILILLHGVGVTGLPRLTWTRVAAWVNGSALPVLFIAGSAFVLIRALHLIAARLPLMARIDGPLAHVIERRKRAAAAGRLLRWGGTGIITAVAGLMLLNQIGVDVTPLLTGGAIASVAVGFGAQNVVRDVITGVFLIAENQVRVGDVATINGKGGLVEEIRLRTIVLRALDGTVHIFPNGSIAELSNLTRDFSYAVLDVGVAYRENVDHVMEVLKGIGEEMLAEPTYAAKALEPLEILGVDQLADSAVIIKIRVKTVPLEQWNVARELRRRVKNTFDERGIEIPFPHLSVYTGSVSKPFAVSVAEQAAVPVATRG